MHKVDSLERGQEDMQKSIETMLNRLDELEQSLSKWGANPCLSSTISPFSHSPYSTPGWPPFSRFQQSFQTPKVNSEREFSPYEPNTSYDPSQSSVAQLTPAPGTAPMCSVIPDSSLDNTLPSQQIPKDKLSTPQAILQKYSKLRGEALAGTLAVKLAREGVLWTRNDAEVYSPRQPESPRIATCWALPVETNTILHLTSVLV